MLGGLGFLAMGKELSADAANRAFLDANAAVDAALAETDRAKQAPLWQALDKQAAEQMWLIPTFFGLTQRMAGSKIATVADPESVYLWSAWGSWPYGDMYVKQ